jgi:succinoglycan biosynthesis transport protein ExoP
LYSFVDWIEAARFRWKLVAAITGLSTLLALLYLAITPQRYVAQSSLIVDRQQSDPVDETKGDKSSSRAVMATQADLVRSPQVAAGAAKAAGLDKDPAYIAEWRQSGTRTPYPEWLKARLLSSVEVLPGKDTNILEISTTAATAAEAARLANGFADAAVASRYRLRTEPAKAYATWLEGRLVPARARVAETQRVLSDFVRKTGLNQGEDLSSEGSQMADMTGQLATAEARAAAARQSAFVEAQGRGEAERSSTVQQLRQDVASRTAKLAQLETTFGPDYPEVQRTKAELATLQSRLNSEVANATSTFASARSGQAAAERQAAAASEQRLRALTSAQKARLGSMGVNVAQYATLRNEFANAQRYYNDLNQRLSTMRLQGAVPQTEVQVLDKASQYLVSRSPNSSLILSLAILLGMVLGSIAAIILEFLDPRVRSLGGIERLLGVKVIGRLSLPKRGIAALPRPPLHLAAPAGAS